MIVYCSHCKYYIRSRSYCDKVTGEYDKEYDRCNNLVYNKNSNCRYYQRTWWKFWVKEGV